MRLIDAGARNLRRLGVLVLLVAAFGISLGLGLTATGAFASHNSPNVIHACVDNATREARFVRDPAQCAANEVPIEWLDLAGSVALEARIAALEAQVPDCLRTEGQDAVFEGCNVHVRNGAGDTLVDNGLGNLIVGYNEDVLGDVRDGSHNVVIGKGHSYNANSGLIVGFNNVIEGPFSSVTGGGQNSALNGSTVNGGHGNIASGSGASVTGGMYNQATGDFASVTGGKENIASGDHASVSGGESGIASGTYSSVSAGDSNEASGFNASVSGGSNNVASGNHSTVSGGDGRTATGSDDWVAGGLFQNF